MRRGLIGGGALAALWLICGWLSFAMARAGGSIATLGLLVPSPMVRGVFGYPLGWALLVQAVTVAAVVAGYALLATWFARRGRLSFAAGWIVAVLVGFAVGAAIDMGAFLSSLGWSGVRGALNTMGVTQVTTWWAAIVGWLPALLARTSDAAEPADAPSRRAMLLAAVVAAIALVLLPVTVQAGSDAIQDQLRQERIDAQASADPDGAAAPDPEATGEPVPTAVPAEGEIPADACTTSNSTLMAPPPDGATGHRGQVVQLVNAGDAPCTLDGYPDVAYGDQNGHLLEVEIDHGGSFMIQDPGPEEITLQPGESAFAGIGWDANSMHGQLVASSLWVAVLPGDTRIAWQNRFDIVPGTTVHVTAWQLRTPAAE